MKLISFSITFALLTLLASVTLYALAKATINQSNSATKVEDDVAGEKEVYIPKDLDDCFAELKKMLPRETIEKMKSGSEKNMIAYHFSLGMWLRNNWGLWKGSRLSKWFNEKGIQHPDDMSGIILDAFWRHLHGKPIQLEEQIKHYQDYWGKMQKQRQQAERKKN